MGKHLRNKLLVREGLNAIADSSAERVGEVLRDVYHPDAEWKGSHPMNVVRGVDSIERTAWRPLLTSFPDLERRDLILIGGSYDASRGEVHDERGPVTRRIHKGGDYVAALGHLAGTFHRDWLGIPATGGVVYLRYGEVHKVEDGRISQSSVLVDVLDVIRQAGFWPVAPSLGAEEMWPGPISADGVVLEDSDPDVSAATLRVCLDMQAALGMGPMSREELLNGPQKPHWHPKMMYYAGAGIGTCRGLSGFVDHHQVPFRISFPDRTGDHEYEIADGKYAVTGGYPCVSATHGGGVWMGLPPTGRRLEMRVMDFYLVDEGTVRENWLPIDIIHILHQMDVDVLARVRNQFGGEPYQ